MATSRTVRTKTAETPPVHPQWTEINTDNIYSQLANMAGGEPEDYQLIHAWANLIYRKDGQIYKITPEVRKEETIIAYNVSRHIIKQQPNFHLPEPTADT